MAAILAAPVAVEYHPRRWPAAPPRHRQRVLDQARLHVRQQCFVAVAPGRFTVTRLPPAQPVEVPTGADLQHPAGHTHWVQISHLVNPGVPRSVSCAKYAAAFLRNTSLGRLQ